MAWKQLIITSEKEFAELIADLLDEYGALSVTLEDAGHQALFQEQPEETPLWSKTKIIALFTENTELKNIISHIQQEIHQDLEYQTASLEEHDWVRQTQRNFPPQYFEKSLWVLPSWCDASCYQGHIVRIDPGLAFGTGTHATTFLCLEWLAANPPKELTVIDYGCGSGILALAALALGAKEVFAIDHDPQALQATKNNAELNNFPKDALQILKPEEVPNIKSPLIIANILGGPLIELSDEFNRLTTDKATLVLSGLLTTEIDKIARSYALNFNLITAKTQEDWSIITLFKV